MAGRSRPATGPKAGQLSKFCCPPREGSDHVGSPAWVCSKGLPACKPVSVPALRCRNGGQQSFLSAGNLFPAQATYPEVVTERDRSCSPIWSCSAWGLPCRRALLRPRCALTTPFHPDPPGNNESLAGGIVFCGTFRKTRFERAPPAVSRHAALWRPDFPPARGTSFPVPDRRLLVRQARIHYG